MSNGPPSRDSSNFPNSLNSMAINDPVSLPARIFSTEKSGATLNRAFSPDRAFSFSEAVALATAFRTGFIGWLLIRTGLISVLLFGAAATDPTGGASLTSSSICGNCCRTRSSSDGWAGSVFWVVTTGAMATLALATFASTTGAAVFSSSAGCSNWFSTAASQTMSLNEALVQDFLAATRVFQVWSVPRLRHRDSPFSLTRNFSERPGWALSKCRTLTATKLTPDSIYGLASTVVVSPND